MQQEIIFRKIMDQIKKIQQQKNKAIRLAINGIEGVGKTTFALNLCTFLQKNGLEAIHVSINGFHFDKKKRYQQGRDSAKGYYEDSYDELSFINKVLLSSQQNEPCYWEAVHDLLGDEYLDLAPISISNQAILITDGAYLFKPNYLPHWDYKIYLQTDFDTARRRGANRDKETLGGIEKATQKFLNRYHAASQLYIKNCDPKKKADLLIDATNFKEYTIIE